MEINYQLTEKDIIDFNIHHLKTSPALKKSVFIQRIIGPLIDIPAIFIAHKLTNISLLYWSVIFISMAILWYAFYPKHIEKRYKKQVSKMFAEGKNKDLFAPSTLNISEDEIVRSSQYKTSKFEWSSVDKIDIGSNHIFIYDSAVSAVIVPFSAFNTDNERKTFLSLLDEYFVR
ncbi:YcxB family protein [Clostridiaceae bacterium M8S5]|nr:YcxB family protein [Clostridiaceae bacterium M8S5]